MGIFKRLWLTEEEDKAIFQANAIADVIEERTTCSYCGKKEVKASCQRCGASLCGDCAKKCKKCGKYFCPRHIKKHRRCF
jgi:predicted Zn-ribbon and HTH transcriptional regulator